MSAKRLLAAGLAVLLVFLAGCAAPSDQSAPAATDGAGTTSRLPSEAQKTPITQGDETMIEITVGDTTVTAILEKNEAAAELAALLQDGPITLPASNYGGFEKVCDLGCALAADDTTITAQPGDVLLYSGSHVVLFYGSNRWAYTRLARVTETDIPKLNRMLSGEESAVTIERSAPRT